MSKMSETQVLLAENFKKQTRSQMTFATTSAMSPITNFLFFIVPNSSLEKVILW